MPGFGKVDPLGNSQCTMPKVEANTKDSNNNEACVDAIALLTQKFIEMIQSQITIMHRKGEILGKLSYK